MDKELVLGELKFFWQRFRRCNLEKKEEMEGNFR
jgi:hypothetical protein